MEDLSRVVASMQRACEESDVQLVTGDTKVVNRGKGDKVFINTTGIGVIERPIAISADRARPGDKVLLSGAIAAHGVAIMLAREEMEFERPILSDTAPLNGLVEDMLQASLEIRCMRDLTRGGLASALNEIAAVLPCRDSYLRGLYSGSRRSQRRMRDSRTRPASRRQRGETDRHRQRGTCK